MVNKIGFLSSLFITGSQPRANGAEILKAEPKLSMLGFKIQDKLKERIWDGSEYTDRVELMRGCPKIIPGSSMFFRFLYQFLKKIVDMLFNM